MVVGVPDETWGEVSPPSSARSPVSPRRPRRNCGRTAGSGWRPFKTPLHWVFVDAFPTTPSGKIQKYKLRESLTARPPPADHPPQLTATLS